MFGLGRRERFHAEFLRSVRRAYACAAERARAQGKFIDPKVTVFDPYVVGWLRHAAQNWAFKCDYKDRGRSDEEIELMWRLGDRWATDALRIFNLKSPQIECVAFNLDDALEGSSNAQYQQGWEAGDQFAYPYSGDFDHEFIGDDHPLVMRIISVCLIEAHKL